MDFQLSEEQTAIAASIDDVITQLGGTAITRAWAAGDTDPGLTLWQQLASLGLTGLLVPEDEGGMGASCTDLTVVGERLGYHATPGPYVESVALLAQLLEGDEREELVGGAPATVAVAGVHPYALDAAAAVHCYALDESGLALATPNRSVPSITAFRQLSTVHATGPARAVNSDTLARALDTATLTNAAMLVGAGERMLALAVEYATVREQFGRIIGEYQALKHMLANVRIVLSFARPLVWNAALSLDTQAQTAARDVSAAKVRSAQAAQLAATAALQVHGAIGYTAEHDLSLWLTWVPALVGAWGSLDTHRMRLAAAVLEAK